MDYGTVKLVHQSAVTLSVTGFVVRGWAALLGAGWVQSRLAKALPQMVDTVLLLSALTLAWLAQLRPDQAPWLLAKIIGLVIYIALGMVALRPGRPLALRWLAFLAALATVGWIISVAILKTPWGVLALLTR